MTSNSTNLRLLFTAALSSAALLAGCVEPADDGLESSTMEAAATVCGEERRLGPDGELVVEPEIFRFSILDGDLAARPDVADVLGFHRVTSCDQARAATAALFGGDVADDSEPEAIARVTDDGEHSLMGGTVISSHRGVVELHNGCTGMLINSRVVVSAAHCLDQWVNQTTNTGTASIRVRYFDPTYNTLVQITNGFENLTVWIHPNWSGSGDPEDDIGVIIRNTPWNNTTTDDYLRIYDHHFGSVGIVHIYGQGLQSETGQLGTLRVATFGIDWYNSWYSITKATSTKRVCGGDSGAPVIKEVDGYELIAGVHSSSDKASSSNECAKSGGNQRHTRLHPTKIDWIEQVTGATCGTFNINGIQYARCW
jgi:V8-like Glu-specific endopeptidase